MRRILWCQDIYRLKVPKNSKKGYAYGVESLRLAVNDEKYPERLRQLRCPPKEIFVRGNVELLNQKVAVAVIGSRKMTAWGMKQAGSLIPDLVGSGVVIVSGMAMGIDAWSQKVCLDSGGMTVAVLASGCDVATPRCNSWLYERILLQRGLVVSLRPGREMPVKEDFLKRNELISGLSDMVVVVEGGVHSGTLVTARLAAEQGREVGAIKGPEDSFNSMATKYLLRNGAVLVEDSADVLNALI